MIKTFHEVPEWNFELDEVSAGVYRVVGTDSSGHMVSATGTNLEELVERCKNDALELSRTVGSSRPIR